MCEGKGPSNQTGPPSHGAPRLMASWLKSPLNVPRSGSMLGHRVYKVTPHPFPVPRLFSGQGGSPLGIRKNMQVSTCLTTGTCICKQETQA